MERMQSLNPFGFILHCNRNPEDVKNQVDAASWQKNIEQSIDELLLSGLSPSMLCIETLDYPFELIEPIIADKKLSICLDIGHILINKLPFENYINQYLGKSRIVHFHGVIQGRDHCDISAIDQKYLSMLLRQLNAIKPFKQVVSLEVFNPVSFDLSLSVMEKFIP